MSKTILKFGVIRNPRSYDRIYNLLGDRQYSALPKSLYTTTSKNELHLTLLSSISYLREFSNDGFFLNLVKVYNNTYRLINQKEKQQQAESVFVKEYEKIFKDYYTNQKYNEGSFLSYKDMITSGLTAIKLLSNRVDLGVETLFIDALKAWSVIKMYEVNTDRNNGSKNFNWIDIYSDVFTIPLDREQIVRNIPDLQKNSTRYSVPREWPSSQKTMLIVDDNNSKIEPLFDLLIEDLILVKEKNTGYLAAEIAHIETAMDGETRSKEHRTLDKSERYLTISETSEFKLGQNLATNSRVDFQSELESILKHKFGANARYGYKGGRHSIDLSTYYDYESGIITKKVSELSKEVVNEASVEVSKKINTSRTEISINEVEIINLHKIENTSGKGHLNGIYQWVNQVKEFSSYNYGRHLIAKIIVPHPAELLVNKLKNDRSTVDIEEFPGELKPTDIRNHLQAIKYGLKYDLTEIEPPPLKEEKITEVVKFLDKAEEISTTGNYYVFEKELNIPNQQDIVKSVVIEYDCPWLKPGRAGERKQLEIAIPGGRFILFSDIDGINITFFKQIDFGLLEDIFLDDSDVGFDIMNVDEEYTKGRIIFRCRDLNKGYKTLPIAIKTRNNNYFQAIITVNIRRPHIQGVGEDEDGEPFYEWQKETYGKIFQAYLNKKEELKNKAKEEKEDTLLIAISGNNPIKNKELIINEIKRQAITTIMKKSEETFAGIFNIDEDQPIENFKKYTEHIDFFENAIDWEKLVYKFYPYYWLKSSNNDIWQEKIDIKDTDPHFEAFLKAGAAEVQVPLKHQHARQFIHYIEQSEMWFHNAPLSVTVSDKYSHLLAEINELEGSNEIQAQAIGQPWHEEIPTNLIILSDKNQLDEITFDTKLPNKPNEDNTDVDDEEEEE